MGRAPVSSRGSEGLIKRPWTEEEDAILTAFVKTNGEGNWRSLPKLAGLRRCRKSCRLRWMNYVRPGLKRGNFSPDENELIAKLHSLLGNRWSLIAGRIPGRTDNEIKNYWNSRLRRKLHDTPSDTVEAIPISCSQLDSAPELQGSCGASTDPSTSLVSEANQSVTNLRECSFPEYAEGSAASSSLDGQIFPEYASFQASGEATPSKPCSSDGTACLDYCSDHQNYSTWPPVASDFSADSMPCAYSPESVFSQGPSLNSEEDFLCRNDFVSISDGLELADHGDTSEFPDAAFYAMSPMHTNLFSWSCPVDDFWSNYLNN